MSGSVVLLQQIYQARFGSLPTVDQVTKWLEQGSDPIHDSVTGITIGRLDIPKSASLIASPHTSHDADARSPVTTPTPRASRAAPAAQPGAARAVRPADRSRLSAHVPDLPDPRPRHPDPSQACGRSAGLRQRPAGQLAERGRVEQADLAVAEPVRRLAQGHERVGLQRR